MTNDTANDALLAVADGWDADDRVGTLEAENERLRQELSYARSVGRGVRLPGHWYVRNLPHGWAATWVGEIADMDRARVRVALEQAAGEAAQAVLALRTPNQDCNVPIINHRSHSGPCATNPSAHDVVMAVLDVVSRRFADDDDGGSR